MVLCGPHVLGNSLHRKQFSTHVTAHHARAADSHIRPACTQAVVRTTASETSAVDAAADNIDAPRHNTIITV